MKQDLEALRELLADPKRFTTGAFARDAQGAPVGPNDEKAVCWCLLGAIRKLEQDWRPGSPTYRRIGDAVGSTSVGAWADANGHAAILALLDQLINDEGTRPKSLLSDI